MCVWRLDYHIWQYAVSVAITLNSCVTLVLLSFVSTWAWMWALCYACDAVAVANVVISFFVVHIDDRGILYPRCRVVARK